MAMRAGTLSRLFRQAVQSVAGIFGELMASTAAGKRFEQTAGVLSADSLQHLDSADGAEPVRRRDRRLQSIEQGLDASARFHGGLGGQGFFQSGVGLAFELSFFISSNVRVAELRTDCFANRPTTG